MSVSVVSLHIFDPFDFSDEFFFLFLVRWAHVVTELYNLSKEINLSFYFLFSISLFVQAYLYVYISYCLSFLCLVITFSRFYFWYVSLKVFCSTGCLFVWMYVWWALQQRLECVWFNNHLSNVTATANASARIHRRFMSPWCDPIPTKTI